MNMKGSFSKFSLRSKVMAITIAISFVSVLFVGLLAETFVPQINSSEGFVYSTGL